MRKLILVVGVAVSMIACGQPPAPDNADSTRPASPARPESSSQPGDEPGRQLAATKGATEAGTEPGSEAAGTAARGSAAEGVPGTRPGRAADSAAEAERRAAPPEPEWREVTVPAGTILTLRLGQSIGSDTSRPEDAVSATLANSVRVKGGTVIPAGSAVQGTITEAKRSGRVKGRGLLHVRFDRLEPRGADETYSIRTGLVTRKAPSRAKKDALEIGAPAVGGAVVGGILGGKKGAIIGGTVGGAAGTAVVLSTRGEEVRLPRGSRLSVRLLDPVTVRVRAGNARE